MDKIYCIATDGTKELCTENDCTGCPNQIENIYAEEQILKFIDGLKEAKNIFSNGYCYWFAHILQNRFGGEIWYVPAENHFYCQIKNNFYDVNGVHKTLINQAFRWEAFLLFDPKNYKTVYRDCVLKVYGVN